VVAVRRIWLLRHGSTASNEQGRFLGWADEDLSAAGRAEAIRLRLTLSDIEPDHVWASDLRRAVETARLAVGEPRVDERLRELDFGELEGKTWFDCTPVVRAALERFEGFRAPGGESLDQLRSRVHSFVDELGAGKHLIVTHGGVIRLLMREAGEENGILPGGLVELSAMKRVRGRRSPTSPARLIRRLPPPSGGW
jgi:probable phosphoglycerate mutase